MKRKSYEVLSRLKKELLDNGFIDLPTDFNASDVVPFRTIWEKYEDSLFEAICEDLKGHVKPENILETLFIPEDEHAQGATICYFYTQIKSSEETIQIVFKCLVFQGTIYCYITGSLAGDALSKLTESSNDFISALARNYESDIQSHLFNL